MSMEGLCPLYLELLKAVSTSTKAQNEFIRDNKIRSMQMAAISSHLTRNNYIIEKGAFQRILEITEKGIDAVNKYNKI